MTSRRKVICYVADSAGDWGGASRVLFTNIRFIDRSRYELLLLLPCKGPIEPTLDELGVRYLIWGPAREPGNIATYVKDLVAAARFLRRNRVDILHINHAGYWRPADVLAAKLLGIPIVTHYHVVRRNPGPFVKYSRLIVAVSQFTADRSLPQDVPKVVIHNTVDLARYDRATDLRQELGLSRGDIVVTFIGQIRRIKGVDLFIRLAHAIAHPGVKFLIVGECRDPARFEGAYTEAQLRAEIGADSRIRFLGYRSDVQNVYASSDIVVTPSRWGEPFGLVNIEAGAASKPVVSTRDGGIPEVVVHGENGFLAEPDDLAGLVRYTTRLIEDGGLRQRMGERAREIVEERFTIAPIRKLEQAYDSITA